MAALFLAAGPALAADSDAILDGFEANGDVEAVLEAARGMERTDRADLMRAAADRLGRPGGSGADFTELIELIQFNTGESVGWQDIDGQGGVVRQYVNGIDVDPLGRLSRIAEVDRSGELAVKARMIREAAADVTSVDVAGLRVVSLTKLERAVATFVDAGEPVPADMRYMAGLTGVSHVFLDEAGGDLLIAGPAERFAMTREGQVVGTTSGRPVLHLDDLVTILRVFSDGGADAFNCLIVPRSSGVVAVQQFAAESAARGPLRGRGATKRFAREIEARLGRQDVEVNGVPAHSRVARVIVEADYLMKLVGVDREQYPGVASYFDLLDGSTPVATQALRWWLSVRYDAVTHDESRTAFAFSGPAVLCRSEDEFLAADGSQIHTNKSTGANRAFANGFTAAYERLCEEEPAFADLRNVFDIALAAAVIRRDRLDVRAGWDRGCFAADGLYMPAIYAPAREVDSVVNYRVYSGGNVVVQAAGGVDGRMGNVLAATPAVVSDRVAVTAEQAISAAGDRWYWDAE
ncbi:MAG: DUF1598 domain-containing protein [Planctomycetota bacterium]